MQRKTDVEYFPNLTEIRRQYCADYNDAAFAAGHLFMGRANETAAHRDYICYPHHQGRLLDPERHGYKWTLECNAAFWMGGIEHGKEFLILTPIEDILDRAHRGLHGKCYDKDKLGYAVAELLWLQDHGYRFEWDRSEPRLVRAVPSAGKVAVKKLRVYGHVSDKDAKAQVQRIKGIIKSLGVYEREPSQAESVMSWRQPAAEVGGALPARNGLFSKQGQLRQRRSANASRADESINWRQKDSVVVEKDSVVVEKDHEKSSQSVAAPAVAEAVEELTIEPKDNQSWCPCVVL